MIKERIVNGWYSAKYLYIKIRFPMFYKHFFTDFYKEWAREFLWKTLSVIQKEYRTQYTNKLL